MTHRRMSMRCATKDIIARGWQITVHEEYPGGWSVQIYDPAQAEPGVYLAPFAVGRGGSASAALEIAYGKAMGGG